MKMRIDIDIDFPLLREQKSTLLEMQGELPSPKRFEVLEGILNLIDTIQDQAVDNYGVSEKEVFSRKEESNEKNN